MSIQITSKPSRDGSKKWFYLEWGKGVGQRMSTKIFTYSRPKDLTQKNHNKEALRILESKRSQMILDHQAIGSGYVPQHKLQSNFLDFYQDFVKKHARPGNRHLQNSLNSFRVFLKEDYISPLDISEDLCKRYRSYLLQRYNGETPGNYFARFKRVLKAAVKQGYFRNNPAEDLASKSNMNFKIKEILEVNEYLKLLRTPCKNYEVQKAFVFSLYTGIRWIDVKSMTWENIIDNAQTFCLVQRKTKLLLERPLHQTARNIIGERKNGLLFQLPTQDGANKVLKEWCRSSGIQKKITWHCARHSFSVLLQDKGTDAATVAGMLGHTSLKYVHKTYHRYREKNARNALDKLPIIK